MNELEMLKIDGFDECIIGQCCCWDGNAKVDRFIYSGEMLIGAMVGDMSEEEALEYIEFNIEGAYVGPSTPIIMWNCEE